MYLAHRALVAVVAGSAMFAAACSNTPQSISPTAPSATAATSVAAQGGDPDSAGEPALSGTTVIDRTLVGASAVVTDPSAVAEWADRQPGWATAADTASLLEVEGTGPITLVAGACPNVVLTIYGIPVTVNAATLFGSNTTCAQLTAGTVVRVRGLVTYTGTTMAVVAVMVNVEDDRSVEGEGRVLAVSGTCPALTISVDGITVQTDAQTLFEPGSGCGDIRVGTRVRVRGVPVAGSPNFRALRVVITGQRHMVEGEGRITATSGACPAVTLSIGAINVQVNAATRYERGSCADLAAGVLIEAEGYRDDGGPIVAASVEFKARHVEGRGSITAVSGTCPAMALTVEGIRVVTNAATRYEHGACTNLAVGQRIEIEGDMRTVDGAVIAEEVEFEEHSGEREVEGEGHISSAAGACPARALVVEGYAVTTTTATVFRNGSCSDLVPGRRIRARARTSSSSAVMLEVEFR